MVTPHMELFGWTQAVQLSLAARVLFLLPFYVGTLVLVVAIGILALVLVVTARLLAHAVGPLAHAARSLDFHPILL